MKLTKIASIFLYFLILFYYSSGGLEYHLNFKIKKSSKKNTKERKKNKNISMLFQMIQLAMPIAHQ